MKTAILGKTGMLGSEVEKAFLENNQNIVATTRRELDAQTASVEDIKKIIDGCDYVINCIGIIKPYIHPENSFEVQRAILVNGLFPHKVATAAKQTGSKVIQIATDCVFDGVKGSYVENDLHNATDIYGKTKSLGEVQAENFLNLRCSIIGREQKSYLSLLEWFLNQPKGAKLNGFKNHLWNGVTTRAFAKLCLGIINNNAFFNGLQHVEPADILSKAQMFHCFREIFDRKDIEIKDIEADVAIDRTVVTLNKAENEKLWKNAGYNAIPTVEEMIKEIK